MHVYLLLEQPQDDVECIEDHIYGVYGTAEEAIQVGLEQADFDAEEDVHEKPGNVWFIGEEDYPLFVVKGYEVKALMNQVVVE